MGSSLKCILGQRMETIQSPPSTTLSNIGYCSMFKISKEVQFSIIEPDHVSSTVNLNATISLDKTKELCLLD